ncbi:hypothetical protein SIID45300_03062 [Candidatus Magnetaquicoccaceae bacterium FCR-1]|uniref:Glycosyltransferase n=1 Tax=Candidatus Magnetaquiglobus chichijimensis TaxID=3141448 RepID=A0ABQ0CCT3_9PROT
MPRVSIIMASYNHAPYVGAAISSILNQTCQDFEIIATDDGSSDGTADVIASFNDPRIKLVRFPTNRGSCCAVNDAIRRASGEFLAPLNSDDMFLPDKLEIQVDYLDQNPQVGAVFGYPAFVDEANNPIPADQTFANQIFYVPNRSQADWLRQFFFASNCLCYPTVMVRRACYDTIGLYDERLSQVGDFDTWVRLVSHYPIHIIEGRFLTAYRVLTNNQNISAPRVDSHRRLLWELPHVLRHYLALPQPLFEETFAPELRELGLNPNGNRAVLLGLISLRTGNISTVRFGMEAMFQGLPAQFDFAALPCGLQPNTVKDLTGQIDLYQAVAMPESAPPPPATPAPTGAIAAPPPHDVTPHPAPMPVNGLRLHLGCGKNILPGWINIDLEPAPEVFCHNLENPLPFLENSVLYVYSEHFLEHLSADGIMTLLGEIHRVLLPGGVLRLSTPDLRVLIDMYLRKDLGEFAALGWSPCELMNEGMRAWGHRYVMDAEELARRLNAAGFPLVKWLPWRQSSLAELNNLEQRPFHGELICEVQKLP